MSYICCKNCNHGLDCYFYPKKKEQLKDRHQQELEKVQQELEKVQRELKELKKKEQTK